MGGKFTLGKLIPELVIIRFEENLDSADVVSGRVRVGNFFPYIDLDFKFFSAFNRVRTFNNWDKLPLFPITRVN